MKINTICIADSYKTKEVLSEEFTNKVCEFDAKVRGLDPHASSEYVRNNKFQYYVGINSWLLLTRSHCPDTVYVLQDMITRHGLLQTIEYCNNGSSKVILGEELDDTLTYLLSKCDKRSSLQILRYLKRFTIVDDTLRIAALNDFFEINKKCNVPYPNEVWNNLETLALERMRVHCAKALKGFKVPQVCKNSARNAVKHFEQLGALSGGACIHPDGHSIQTVAEKTLRLAAENGYMFDPLIPTTIPYSPYGDTVRPNGVPKSYKTYRIIAPEDPYRQWCQTGMRKMIEGLLVKNKMLDKIDIHDQEKSRSLCLEASISGDYATIDFSAASDSISDRLASIVLPEEVYTSAKALLPKYFLHPDGRKRRKFMFSSAGSAITFVLESIIFWSLCESVSDLCRNWIPHILPPRVYGDDCIIDSRLYDTFIEIATRLGFSISVNKSFASHDLLYREACGAEFERGIDMASIYWPRHALLMNRERRDECLNLLIQHQHRVAIYRELSIFLCAVVRRYIPDMTSHYPGTICSDLWEELPVYKEALAPHRGKLIEVCDYHCRQKHYEYTQVDKQPTHLPRVSRPAHVEAYLYYKFLKDGPLYDDPLMELLGISSRPASSAELVYGSVSQFKVRIES